MSQLGRPDDGTETTGFFNIEFSVDLKPDDQWPAGITKTKLVKQIDDKLTQQFPGVSFSYSQNIEDNIDEAISGVKAGENAIKVFGPDLATDERIANDVRESLGGVPGVVDEVVLRSMGQPNLQITPDRAACARYGLNVGDVGAIVQAAIGGQAVTQVLEGDRRFDLVVRWKPEYRESLDAVRQIRVNLPAGGQIPLDQVAKIETAEGASFIYREALQRYVPVRFSVRDRDLQSTVLEAKRRIANDVHLPEGVHLEWSGEYGELQAANRRFAIVVPFALLLIAGVLYARDPIAHRHLHHHGADSGRVSRRSPGADHHRYTVQRFGRRGIHFDFRNRGDGRHPAELLHPPALGGGQSVCRVDHHRLRPSSSRHDDDRLG